MSLLFLACLAAGPPGDAPRPQKHWALQPRSRPALPRCEPGDLRARIRNPVDAFLLDRQRKAGLRPAEEADRATLIRRLTFDLIGLPPTPAEVQAFVEDARTQAYEELVERLLASPRYGERWGRHWLDVVRHAETEGFEYDRERPGAWRYRDHIVRAFNDDTPYDRFLLEQIAGDEVEPSRTERLAAAGFHRLGPIRRNAGNQKVAFSRNEVLTEMTDAIGAVFLGLTVGCARCHDHKFDNFSQTDYYRLQAFLAATQEHDVILADARAQAEWKAHTEKITAEVKQLQAQLKNLEGAARQPVQEKIRELQQSQRPPLPTISTVRNVEAERTAIHVLKRGDPDRPGSRVGPGVPRALAETATPDLRPDVRNPRTLLANWLNEPAHPLTARVLVNRLWQYHFGRGIVATANDFGVNGAAPSHPELLDWLANEFLAGGRRLKPMHRLIVLSSAYRQSAVPADAALSRRVDPENRLLARFPRRRLDAEQLRDAMLAIAGRLNSRAGGPSVVVPVESDLVKLLYDPAQWRVTPDVLEHDRRSIYLLAKRNLGLPFAQVFDQPDTQTSCPQREQSTHALQALELLNGTLSNRLAREFAERLQREAGRNRSSQVTHGYQLVAGRPPTRDELAVALEFLKDQPLAEFTLALFNLNAFLYVN